MVEIARGAVVIVAIPGDYGKPRPSIVIESDRFIGDFDSVIICPMTMDELDHAVARIAVAPTPANGLRATSKIMVDKILAVPRAKISKVVGKLDPEILARLNSSLAALLDLR